jgi:hypothetical protein
MDKERLKALQAPLKAKYRDDPDSAVVTLHAEGLASEGVSCRLDLGRALVDAGLHQAAGGDGSQACSGDMLLQALVACAGVTLRAVATSLGIPLGEAKFWPRATSIFAGLWPLPKMLRSAFARSACTFLSIPRQILRQYRS